MRLKLITWIFVVLMVLGLLSSTALADPGEYDANDVAKLKAFLEQPSAVAGKTNAEQLGYDVNDPSTWTGIWQGQRVKNIYWDDRSLAGTLDLTGCDELQVLSISENAITSLNVSNLTNLIAVYCQENNINSLNITGCTSLNDLDCSDNLLTALDLTGLSTLSYLACNNNKLTTLDVNGNASINQMYCSKNKLSVLDLSAQTGLIHLNCADNMIESLILNSSNLSSVFCQNNKLTSLNLGDSEFLTMLNCKNNALTAVDLSKYYEMRELDVSGNKISSLKAMIEDKDIELTADGSGYIGLAYKQAEMEPFSVGDGMAPMKFVPQPGYFYVEAVPAEPSTFVRWMDADAKEISKSAKIDLTPGQGYKLTAKFLPPLAIESSVPSGTIYTSGRITLTPNIPGGTWTWDETFFSATFNSPATFTALRSGTSRVTYTVEGMSTHYDITAVVAELPATGQDYTWVYILCAAAFLVSGAAVMGYIRKKRSSQY